MMTDTIADMLTRIRNNVRIEKPHVEMPTSKIRKGIAQVLKDEGYIWDFEEVETVPAAPCGCTSIRPQRRAIDHEDRPREQAGLPPLSGVQDAPPGACRDGIQILSTPKGILSDRRARELKVGGEVLALIH